MMSLPPASAGLLLGIFLNPEGGSDIVFQNIKLFLNYMTLQP
jgi:hypothetical protein